MLYGKLILDNSIKIKARIERNERNLIKDITTFSNKIMKIHKDYNELIFNLSESGNESIKSIKSMSLGERIEYQQNIIKRNKDVRDKNKS